MQTRCPGGCQGKEQEQSQVGSRRHTSIAAPHRLLVSITLIHSQIGVLNLDRAMGNAKTFFHRLLRSQERLVEAHRLETRTKYDVEMIREIGYCPGIEKPSRLPLHARR